MSQYLWYLSRSTGIVATVLIVAALVWGLFFSSRSTGNRRRPKWWLDLHNYLGGLAFVFTVLHMAISYADNIDLAEMTGFLLPIGRDGIDWSLAWGYLSVFMFAALVFTSWPKKRLGRRGWLLVHLLSVPAAVMAAAHGWMIGSSRGTLWFGALLAGLAGLSVYPAVLRVARIVAKHWPTVSVRNLQPLAIRAERSRRPQ